MRWSIASLETFKIFYEDIEDVVVKDWCRKNQDLCARVKLRYMANSIN